MSKEHDFNFKAAAVFSSHMILQRDKPAAIWGTAPAGQETVSARLCGCEYTAKPHDGKWRITLPPQPAGGPHVLELSCGAGTLRFDDVLFGDVFLAGGQSNMELTLRESLNGESVAANADYPDIRFYNVPRQAFTGAGLENAEKRAGWQCCTSGKAGELSAVAFYCMLGIRRETGVPLGVISCSWGGTSATAWTGKSLLERSVAGRRVIDEYNARLEGVTDQDYERAKAAHDAAWLAWHRRIEKLRAEQPDVSWAVLNAECGDCPWPYPAGRKSPYRPHGLYESMLSRVSPYTLKSFLYYQGEEDSIRCNDYFELMCLLILQWRSDWEDDSLPFCFVQLPMYSTTPVITSDADTKEWCVVREQQQLVYRFVRNTGLAVAIDCGELDNIHPLDKQTVGGRLALQVLEKAYGMDVGADGPFAAGVTSGPDCLRVSFTNADSGLVCRGAVLDGFEAVMPDGKPVPAEAKIDGSTVLVYAPPDTCQLRYAWYSYGPTPLYSASGLPVAPFRINCGHDSRLHNIF